MADYTCDAGHGCKITCSGSCGATYDHSTGHCHTWCQPARVEIRGEGPFSIHLTNVPAGEMMAILGRSTALDSRAAGKAISLKLTEVTLEEIAQEIARLAQAD